VENIQVSGQKILKIAVKFVFSLKFSALWADQPTNIKLKDER
jgi:hypothetical protein